MIGYPEPTRNDRVPMPTRCIDCSTVSAIARMPVPRAATDGMRQSCCNRSVKLRACLSTYLSNFVKIIGYRNLLKRFHAKTQSPQRRKGGLGCKRTPGAKERLCVFAFFA